MSQAKFLMNNIYCVFYNTNEVVPIVYIARCHWVNRGCHQLFVCGTKVCPLVVNRPNDGIIFGHWHATGIICATSGPMFVQKTKTVRGPPEAVKCATIGPTLAHRHLAMWESIWHEKALVANINFKTNLAKLTIVFICCLNVHKVKCLQ